MQATFKKVWGIPVLLASLTLFGLLAALLGTGYWYGIAWAAMIVAPAVVCRKVFFQKK